MARSALNPHQVRVAKGVRRQEGYTRPVTTVPSLLRDGVLKSGLANRRADIHGAQDPPAPPPLTERLVARALGGRVAGNIHIAPQKLPARAWGENASLGSRTLSLTVAPASAAPRSLFLRLHFLRFVSYCLSGF
jgi:hypothetical protein